MRNTSGLKRGGPGRPKGVPNRTTLDARRFCSSIVDDPTYRRKLLERARAGELAPAVESLLWHYAHGRPKAEIEFAGKTTTVNIAAPSINIAQLSDEGLEHYWWVLEELKTNVLAGASPLISLQSENRFCEALERSSDLGRS